MMNGLICLTERNKLYDRVEMYYYRVKLKFMGIGDIYYITSCASFFDFSRSETYNTDEKYISIEVSEAQGLKAWIKSGWF